VAARVNPFLHYVEHGSKEGRDPGPDFHTKWYASQLSKEDLAGSIPLVHYLKTGKKNGLKPYDEHKAYDQLVLIEAQRHVFEHEEYKRHIDVMMVRPSFVVFIEGSDQEAINATKRSLQSQLYQDYVETSDINAVSGEDEKMKPIFFIWLRAGDLLHHTALYRFASAINSDWESEVFYGDEDMLKDGRRRIPFFKPDWSPDYLESFNYVGHASCFKLPLVRTALEMCDGFYDFVLRATELTHKVRHIREVILHRQPFQASRQSDIQALQGRLVRTGRRGVVEAINESVDAYSIALASNASSLVSVVIPTAGNVVSIGDRSIDLIVNCIERISRSEFKNLEFIVVDNGDLTDEQIQSLAKYGCKHVTYTETKFNVAKKLNLGARHASGEFLLLMNDDIEPLVPDWIDRMLDQFAKPHVGVVGAKLLYPNETTQHVGVVVCSGSPDHLRRTFDRDDEGYFYSTCAVRNYSAVTGACMMTRTDIYKQVGGYTEDLAISYNDVDYCLKVRSLGLTAVYTPFAELTHFESQSREAKLDHSEADYFAKKWAKMLWSDPFYNENRLNVLPSTYRVMINRRQL
jgi:GT2 family glycosyltransferase